MRSLELSAQWWNPQLQNTPVGGNLRYSPTKGASLDLIGTFDDGIPLNQLGGSKTIPQISVIYGVTTNGRAISLHNNLVTRSRIGSSGYPTQSLKPQIILQGAHVPDIHSAAFATAFFDFSYLQDWCNRSGFSWQQEVVHTKPNSTITLTFSMPEPVLAQIGDTVLSVETLIRPKPETYNPSISQTTLLRINTAKEINIFQWMDSYMTPFQHFLTFATGNPNSVTRFDLRLKEDTIGPGRSHSGNISAYFEPVFFEERDPSELEARDMLFTLRDVEDLNSILSGWFIAYEQYKQAINLFASGFYFPHRYMDSRFMHSVQVIEVLYSYLVNDHDQGAPKNKTRKALNYLYEQSSDVIEPLVKSKSRFISQVVKARSYYTHYSPNLAPSATNSVDIFWLNEVLIIMVQRTLLKIIGVSSQRSKHIFEKNKRYSSVEYYSQF